VNVADNLAKVWTEFDRMRIIHDRLEETHGYFSALRKAKIKNPRSPQRFVSIFAPTHSGKSMAIRTYIETVVVDQCIAEGMFPATMARDEIAVRQKKVLHISLEGVTNPKQLGMDILRALGVEDLSGNTSEVLKRAYDFLKEFGTELLAVDEVQHLSTPSNYKPSKLKPGETRATPVTNVLKTMMIRGLIPIVFIGIEQARYHLFNDDQLALRCLKELNFKPLRFTVATERKLFEDFCALVGLKLKQHGLFPMASDFLSGDIPACLHAVGQGRIGVVSRVAETAAALAMAEGARRVNRSHLEMAVDEWAIPNNTVDYNPFRDKVRTAKKVAA
jgi:hypothetical protein